MLAATDTGAFALGAGTSKNDLTSIRNEVQYSGGPVSKEAQDRLENILQTDPGNMEAHLLLAFGYVNLYLLDLAREQCAQIVNGAPSAQKVVDLAQSLIKVNNTRLGCMLLEAGAVRYPSDSALLAAYADASLKMENRTLAKSILERALAQNPKQVGVPTALAELLLQERKYEEALQLADTDIKLRPDFNWHAWQVKGEALIGLARYPQALVCLRKAYAQAPFALGIAKTYGNLCFWSGHYKEALEPLLAAVAFSSSPINLNPEDGSWTTDTNKPLITVMRMVPKSFVAEKMAGLSDRLDHIIHNAFFHFSVANAMDQAGLHGQAIDQYKAGLKIYRSDPRALLALARDFEDNGQYTEAESYYQQLHKERPTIQEYSEYLSRIRNRLAERHNDLSWQLKDWLRAHM